MFLELALTARAVNIFMCPPFRKEACLLSPALVARYAPNIHFKKHARRSLRDATALQHVADQFQAHQGVVERHQALLDV